MSPVQASVQTSAQTSALEAFATQLKAWRKMRCWSQVDLAGKLLYSDSLVSGIETMTKTPTLDFAKRCDDVFDAPGTFLVLHALLSREAWPSYFAPVIDFTWPPTSSIASLSGLVASSRRASAM